MALIREPKNIDLIVNSTPWTEQELLELRAIIKKSKQAKAKRKTKLNKTTKKEQLA